MSASALQAACVSEFPIIFSKSPFPVLQTVTYKHKQIYTVMMAGVIHFLSSHINSSTFFNQNTLRCDFTANFESFDNKHRRRTL